MRRSSIKEDHVALFTGQGSQFPGMGKSLYENSKAARELFNRAESIQPGILKLCFEGPEDELVLTENTQPCILTVDLAAFAAASLTPRAALGHSLGEYAALVAAGSLEFEAALPLVKERGRSMQLAVPEGEGGMAVLRSAELEEAKEIAASIESGICELANINAPGQYVLSGESVAIDEVIQKLGRRAMRLKVSVPFHCSMLARAGEGFASELARMEFKDPAFPIYCNVDAKALTRADDVRDALARQYASSVLWQPSMEEAIARGYRNFIEYGPKATLTKMALQIARPLNVELQTACVARFEDLDGLDAA